MNELCSRTLLLYGVIACCCLTGCQHLSLTKNKMMSVVTKSRSAKADEANRQQLTFELARRFEENGKLDEAAQLYTKLAKNRHAASLHRLAVIHANRGEFSAAESFFRKALKRDNHNAEIHCDFGYAYYLVDDLPQAQTHLERALKLSPELQRAHNNLGLVCARLGQTERAVEEFLAAGCDSAQAHVNLAVAAAGTADAEEARHQLQLALQQNPSLPAAHELSQEIDRLLLVSATEKAGSSITAADTTLADSTPAVAADAYEGTTQLTSFTE